MITTVSINVGGGHNLASELSIAVRRIMTHHAMSQREVAERVGVSEKHLSQILTGAGAASVVMWDRILTAVTTTTPAEADVEPFVPLSARVVKAPPDIANRPCTDCGQPLGSPPPPECGA